MDAPAPVRALPVGTDNFYGTFGVSAYAYTGDWSDDCTPNYMYDVAVAPSGKLWASANTYYWPGSACRLRFFAYAPRGNAAYAFSGADAAGAPTLRCVIPAGAKIEILFNDGTEDHLLTASIGGTLWPMGKTVTYRISTTSINWVYTLEAKGPRPYSFRGEYDEYAVTSYRTHVVTGQQEPVAWSETYSLDGGKSWTDVPPRWTNGFVGSGEGSTKHRSYSLYVREQTPVVHNGAAEKLMNTPPKGTADRPWNLSNRTGADAVENTANCYVINGPGHYSFPLVYGNAIRNGADNPAAYSSTSTNPYVLKQFVNYINYPITRPYIDEGYAYPLTSAEILWQDEPGLVTDVRYHAEPGRGTISFAVPRETIKEGNAVIVLKDERGQAIWSWHIWVTSADVKQTIRCAVLKEGPPVMADANGTWDDTRKGFHFYCDETKSGTVFLPTQSMRTYVNGKVVDYATFGYYWTAGNTYRDHKPGPAPAPPADAPSCGHTMMFRGDVKVVDPFTCSGHAYALPVRAVREEAN